MDTIEMVCVDSNVKIIKCEQCPTIVGKEVVVSKILENDQFVLCFGRGRPQKNRPYIFSRDQLQLLGG